MNVKVVILGLVLFFLSGCAVGQYHLGYHNIGNGRIAYSAVGKKYVENLNQFEANCIKKIVSYNADALSEFFAPNISINLTSEQLKSLNESLKRRYEFTGEYEQLLLVPQKFMLDEGVGKDAFEFYDFVGVHYLAKGKVSAVIMLYMYKSKGVIKLVGFEIVDYDENPNGNNNPKIKYLYPETVDNAKMKGRPYKIVK